MKKALQIGGIAAGVVLIGFGIASIVLAIKGGNTVNSNLSQEFITGTPDMTPSGIQPEVDAIKAEQQKIAAAQKKAKVPAAQQYTFTSVEAPSCSVAGESVDDGNSALCFGKYMRIHALGASSGLTYSQMGQYAAKPDAPVQSTDFNGGTSDPKYAQIDPKTGQARLERCPQPVGDRDVTHDSAQPRLHRQRDLPVRDRGRHRAPAERHRFPDPGSERGDRACPVQEVFSGAAVSTALGGGLGANRKHVTLRSAQG